MSKPSILSIILVGALLSCNAHNPDPVESSNCFTGTWGNDYILCGFENTATPGKGSLEKRLEEELKLVFVSENQAYLQYYDCRNKKPLDGAVSFTYSIQGNQLVIGEFLGTPDEIRLNEAFFNYRKSFPYECRQDTLFMPDIMKFSSYPRGTYFVKRN